MTTSTTSATTSTVNTTGGVSYLTGTASGLDTTALVNAAVAQKTAPAVTLDSKIAANTAKLTAYQSLQSLISGLSTSMSMLAASNFSSVATATNAFQSKAVTLTSSDSTAASAYLAVSVGAGAASTTSTISVDQLATAQKVASSAMDSSTALGMTGVVSLGDGAGRAQAISVTPTMTLSDVASAINAAAPTSGVSASLIQISSGNYKLVLSANDTNSPITSTVTSGDDVLNGLGFTDATGAFTSILQDAKPSLVTIDGVQISSDTNNLTGAVSGLDLTLLKTTAPGATLNMAVQPDYSGVKTAITGFITAYNSLRDFVNTNQAVGADGAAASTAVLFADPLLRDAGQHLNALLFGDSASATGSIRNLADLGITLDANNKLVLWNESGLDNALLGDISQVSRLFQSSFTTSDSALKVLQNTSTSAFHFTLDVTVDSSGVLTGASVSGDSSLFSVSGARIVGTKGGPYDGLSFALVGSGDTSIDVDIAPGLANQITTYASQYDDANSGLVQQKIASLTTQDTAWKTDADKIRTDAAAYQAKLVTKYANMEAEVSAAKVMQAQIAAILNGNSNNG
jgi:flagellar hook-associated protein 2